MLLLFCTIFLYEIFFRRTNIENTTTIKTNLIITSLFFCRYFFAFVYIPLQLTVNIYDLKETHTSTFVYLPMEHK